jgi:hypothetical protein
MAKISTYPVDSSINGLDILIGSDADDSNITKNYQINGIKAYVLSGLGVDLTLVLSGQENTNQEPTGLDIPLQVKFGAAQGSPSTPVQLFANGDIKFNQAGLYLFNGYASFERQGSSGGTAVIAFRALINGIQISPSKMVEIATVGVSTPYELTIPLEVNAGDILTWQIMRDSSGVDRGGLYAHTLLGGWSNVPSSGVNVWKIGI